MYSTDSGFHIHGRIRTANAYVLQARLELLEDSWKGFEAEYNRWLGAPMEQRDNHVKNNCFLAGEEAYLQAKASLRQRIDALRATPVELSGLSDGTPVRRDTFAGQITDLQG